MSGAETGTVRGGGAADGAPDGAAHGARDLGVLAPDGAGDGAPPLLSAEQVKVVFPGRRGDREARAVDGVDLDVRPGEIVALVGESGCGKTTLARSLLGLVTPTSGRVTFDGKPLEYASRALKAYRRRAQLVLQDPSGSLNPRHTVYEAVAEGLRIHGYAGDEQEAVAGALSRAGLRPPERFFLRHPHELSGGQRQRVVIAGALVLEPELIVADEPVASLDASVRGEILALLLRLRDELGLSALIVTHDLGLAWNIADRVAVMYLGRIVETGEVEQVLTAPRHPYTRALLSVLPESETEPVILTGEPPTPPGSRRAAASTPVARCSPPERPNAPGSPTPAARGNSRCWPAADRRRWPATGPRPWSRRRADGASGTWTVPHDARSRSGDILAGV